MAARGDIASVGASRGVAPPADCAPRCAEPPPGAAALKPNTNALHDSAPRRVVIVPGNGAGCASANFYPWLADALRARGHEVALAEMPDADAARAAIWLPFIADVLRADADCVLVGHSSGACAALRLAAGARLHAVVAVSATPSDLGDAGERASGWYDAPWDWRAVRRNVAHAVLFASDDDPFIPLSLQREVRDGLQGCEDSDAGTFEYVELHGRSHFFARRQPEILDAVLRVAAAPARAPAGASDDDVPRAEADAPGGDDDDEEGAAAAAAPAAAAYFDDGGEGAAAALAALDDAASARSRGFHFARPLRALAAPDAAAAAARARVVLVGSSILQQWREADARAAFAPLALANRAVGGFRTTDLARAWARVLPPPRAGGGAAQVIVLYAGSNDLKAGLAPAGVIARLRAAAAALSARGHALVLLASLRSPDRAAAFAAVDEVNAAARALCDEAPAARTFVDADAALGAAGGGVWQADGLHLRREGYAALAAALRAPVLAAAGMGGE